MVESCSTKFPAGKSNKETPHTVSKRCAGSLHFGHLYRPSTNGLLECLMVFNMPFTFVKGMIDVALCFLIYKPLSPLLHK